MRLRTRGESQFGWGVLSSLGIPYKCTERRNRAQERQYYNLQESAQRYLKNIDMTSIIFMLPFACSPRVQLSILLPCAVTLDYQELRNSIRKNVSPNTNYSRNVYRPLLLVNSYSVLSSNGLDIDSKIELQSTKILFIHACQLNSTILGNERSLHTLLLSFVISFFHTDRMEFIQSSLSDM